MALINNTKSPNRVTGILNLTPGVWKMIAGGDIWNGYLYWVQGDFKDHDYLVKGEIKPCGERYRGVVAVSPNGNLMVVNVGNTYFDWNLVEFERVADTIDLVLCNNPTALPGENDPRNEYWAYYSAQAARVGGGSVYRRANGEEVRITCVTKDPTWIKNNYRCTDIICLGKVEKWVGSF